MRFLFSAFWILSANVLLAQTDPYAFMRLGRSSGLSHQQVNCILKDKQGFVWFGTLSGLNRFDGYTCKVFRQNVQDTTSLNDNYIETLVEDPAGRLWIRNRKGITVYDPVTERFDRRPDALARSYGLPDGNITTIRPGKRGTYWFLHNNQGVFGYSPTTQRTVRIAHARQDTASLRDHTITDIAEDGLGHLWVIHQSGLLEKLDRRTHRAVYRAFLVRTAPTETANFKLFVDADNDVWVHESKGETGAFYVNSRSQTVSRLHTGATRGRLNNNLVRSIIQDSKGQIWLGTDHGGINVLNKNDFSVRYLLNQEGNDRSVSQNTIYTQYCDDAGIVWVGTYKNGVCYYHPDLIRFSAFRHSNTTASRLPYDDVNAFAEDARGNLWIGTNGGGLLYFDRQQTTFTTYRSNSSSNSLSSDVIVSLLVDKQQQVWIGTYLGGLNRLENGRFTRYLHRDDQPGSLAINSVWEIFEDAQRNFWVGTLGGGLDRMNRATGWFDHYRMPKTPYLHSDYISAIQEDRYGNLWIGHGYGVDIWDRRKQKCIHYTASDNTRQGLSHNNVTAILEDGRGWIWIGTIEGLNLYDRRTGTFRFFKKENGLSDNTIQSLVEDDAHNLWIGTPNGLSHLLIQSKGTTNHTFTFRTYDEADGLPSNLFNDNAGIKTRRGELVFGGPNGFTVFDPKTLGINRQIPKIVLTDLQVFNQYVRPGERYENDVLLDRSITQTQELTLTHRQNMFSIGFAALNYFHPEKNTYQYKLEGFNDNWITADPQVRRATFTNLNPGTYTFLVRAANNDGVWNTDGVRLQITVLPPFWKSPTALILYIVLMLGALWLARWVVLERARITFQLEQERQQAQQLHELDLMKIKFLTNVSHEFRTPLTLILSPLDRLLKHTKDPGQLRQFELIQRNARRLLNLVNQLLDFRRMEVQELKLNLAQNDVIKFSKEIFYSFSDLSERKNIRFSFQANVTEVIMYFDPDKLERILFNLLSNAFKFTPENGKVSLRINAVEPGEQDVSAERMLEIGVSDTGIGIPAEKHEQIFERFFQNDIPGTLVNQGSGIGLAITKEFVRLHGGRITVDSAPDQGSTFTVQLPIRTEAEQPATYRPVQEAIEPRLSSGNGSETVSSNGRAEKKATVLLVEDNEDFRFYLKDNLREQYTILEAANGRDGWRQAQTHLPNLIVSDVMMPEMDGITLCGKIKNDKRTAHIPVLLLTARSAEEQKLEGLETGASDYITKPFNFEILQARIRNLIAHRDLLERALRKPADISPSDIEITSLDEKLIQRALSIVEQNMSNADFSVEELSREMGMSRVHLYKKLLALTNRTPIEFIRTVRLQRAAQLLERSQLTVAEVAYQVGFNNPKYFTKYFKQEFNTLPSAFGKEKPSDTHQEAH
ncbi:hybrid sensor histidine kinase/response regulator transcription factor [Fibrisoma limi]|nr:two-component regulator propeller domain-containing protein [Fibrisoma limi]